MRICSIITFWLFDLFAAGMIATPVYAAEIASVTDESQLDAFLPRQQSLEEIVKKISANPDNLDNYYAYAKAAIAMKQFKEAIWAYQTMLSHDKTLDRVRLDLSIVYITQKQFFESRQLLDEVLSHNPPQAVQDNIHALLAKMGNAGKRHVFTGSVSTGFNHDTNAAAAPNSGNVTVLDTTVPLSPTQRKKADLHNFSTATLSYIYQPDRLSECVNMHWKTSGTNYNTIQNDLKDLDIKLFSFRTGPEFFYDPLGIRVEIAAVYNYLTLNHNPYLRNPRLESTVEVPLNSQLSAQVGYVQEYRYFDNSPTVTTFQDRSGLARQEQVGLHYIFSERSAWDLITQFRHENASQEFQANNQSGLIASYTHMFDEGYFGVSSIGMKRTHYAVPDPLTSVGVRVDSESTYQLVAGKHFEKYNLILSGGYTYTDTRSTIQNYTYDNHRLSLTLTKNF